MYAAQMMEFPSEAKRTSRSGISQLGFGILYESCYGGSFRVSWLLISKKLQAVCPAENKNQTLEMNGGDLSVLARCHVLDQEMITIGEL